MSRAVVLLLSSRCVALFSGLFAIVHNAECVLFV